MSISINITENDQVVELSVNESRDAYELAVASGYTGTREEWLALTTQAINSSLLSGKGYLIGSSESGVAQGFQPGDSGTNLISDPSQPLGFRWAFLDSIAATGVSSFNGREGVVISESGDYSDTGITNTSDIEGDSVFEAFNSINLRINNTGDDLYQYLINSTGDLETRLVSTGDFLINLNSETSGELNFRFTGLEDSVILKTDSGNFLNLQDSGRINFYLTGGDSALSIRLKNTGDLTVLKSDYDSHSILAAQSAGSPQAISVSNYQVVGKQLGNGIVAIGKPSTSEILNKTETELRVYSPQDIGSFLNHSETGLINRIENTGSDLVNLNLETSGAIDFRITGLQNVVLLKSDSGNFLDLQDSGNINFNITGEDANLSNRIDNSGEILINLSGQIETNISQKGNINNQNWEGEHNFDGANSLSVPTGESPTLNANGEIAIDTSVPDFSHGIIKYYSDEEMAVIAVPIDQLSSPTDGYVITYNATNDEFELVAASGGGGISTGKAIAMAIVFG